MALHKALLLAMAAIGLQACSETPAPVAPTPEAQVALVSAVPFAMQDSVPYPSAVKPVSPLRALLDAAYLEDMQRAPSTASTRGINTWQDSWNSFAPAFFEEQRQIWEQRLARLATFDRAQLDSADQLSYDLYEQSLRRAIASDAFRKHKYSLTQIRGAHTAVPSFLIGIHRIRSAADAQAYIGRLNAVGQHLDENRAQLDLRAEQGMFLPAWAYPKILEASRNVITGAPFAEGPDSSIWADFRGKLALLDLPEEQSEALLDAARAALLEVVEPAYRRFMATVAAHGDVAPIHDGVWKFPNGDAFYAERLRWYTTTALSADEIHAIGLREVARIHADMQDIMTQVGFEGSRAQFFEFMRTDPQFYFSNDNAGRNAYLRSVEAAIAAMKARLPEVFGLLPQTEVIVKRVEPFRERSAGKAFYQGPPADGSRPGTYYANLYNMADMPVYQLEALAFHEGVPGHHMQRGITVALQDLPEFQKYASFTAFTEGWGLYSEELAKDMGFYDNAYSDFGRLAMELWRAARLVVDTGIHSKRWTREEAIAYLVENTPNPPGDAARAAERYIVAPGQATAYMIGKLKIMALRQLAHDALGERFSLSGFHDEVLRYGPLPLDMLEQRIGRWIVAQQG